MTNLDRPNSNVSNSRTALSWLPVVCGVTPLAVAVTSYLISVAAGKVPSCMVFIEGCTSISAAGRNAPAVYFFKGVALPLSTLVLAYWWLAGHWLRGIGAALANARTVQLLGLAAVVFFVVYATLLGSEGPAYRAMRRYGVVLYFAFTGLAQMYLARGMLRAAPERQGRLARIQVSICALLLAIGLGVVLPELVVEVPSDIENIVEWNFALLMNANIALTFFAWRSQPISFRITVHADP